ncbi:hypothetical protein [Sanyastnella coralliicola]|uniref:hypothetical protein n=1 Tax=Sanyastnella coralliicola TaxID=3069118 RepID=UPI0027B94911|nr:hypothetical protein [Longitalea sp. SCSIO 12813]
MNRTLYTLSLVLFTLFLCSCEGNTDYVHTIHNFHNERITVIHQYIVGGDALDQRSIEINPGDHKEVIYHSQLGGRSEPGPLFTYEDYLTVINAQGDTMTKDIYDDQYWEVYSTHEHKVPSAWRHDFHFSVKSNDFE